MEQSPTREADSHSASH